MELRSIIIALYLLYSANRHSSNNISAAWPSFSHARESAFSVKQRWVKKMVPKTLCMLHPTPEMVCGDQGLRVSRFLEDSIQNHLFCMIIWCFEEKLNLLRRRFPCPYTWENRKKGWKEDSLIPFWPFLLLSGDLILGLDYDLSRTISICIFQFHRVEVSTVVPFHHDGCVLENWSMYSMI